MSYKPLTTKQEVLDLLNELDYHGFDYVPVAEKARLVYACGGGVYTQNTCPDEVREYLSSPSDKTNPRPAAVVTISSDGGSLSAQFDAHSSLSGYRGHDFWAYVGPDTIILDWRPIPWEVACTLAVRGPMCNPDIDAPSRFRPDMADPFVSTLVGNYGLMASL